MLTTVWKIPCGIHQQRISYTGMKLQMVVHFPVNA
uniref:Uncharacterized protein n=1 Tax=Arundo donax TaxID=35708 RepID=A0A0A8ZDI8_ARUDO